MNLVEVEMPLNLKVITNTGRTVESQIEINIEVGAYTHIEQCHDYHTFYDIDENDAKNKIQQYLENLTNEEATELLLDNEVLEENEKVVEIIMR